MYLCDRSILHNTLKIRVLGALDGWGWLNAAMVASLVGFHPKRAIYIYMERLREMRLVRRRRSRRGLLVYAISERGRKRLAWLQSKREEVCKGKP